MIVLFRVDAYPQTGLGHFVRSVAIAQELRRTQTGIKICFAGIYSKDAQSELKNKEFPILQQLSDEDETEFCMRIVNETKCRLLFIDNLYPYKKEFTGKIAGKTGIIFFHNLSEGVVFSDAVILPSAHYSDVVINDPRWKENSVEFYNGFEYIPINEEVKKARTNIVPENNPPVVSITTGGSDPEGIMVKILEWLDNEFPNVKFEALTGSSFIHVETLESMKKKLPSNIKIKSFNYNSLAHSDLVISSFGVTSYELIYLGIPFISIAHADSNALGSYILSQKFPLIKNLGLIHELSSEIFLKELKDSLNDKMLPLKFREISNNLIDGRAIYRIVEIIQKVLMTKS